MERWPTALDRRLMAVARDRRRTAHDRIVAAMIASLTAPDAEAITRTMNLACDDADEDPPVAAGATERISDE